MGWIVAIATWLLKQTAGWTGKLSDTTLRDALVGVWATIASMAEWIKTITDSEHGAWQFSHPQAVGAAWGLGETAYALAHGMVRIVDVIVPNSLAWLDGETHQWVDAKYDPQLSELYSDVDDINDRLNRVQTWRNAWVDPQLTADLGYRQFLQGWPQSQWFTIKGWFADPAVFARWATAPLIGPTIAYYADRAHADSRDNMTAALLPSLGVINRKVDDALAAWLDSEW